MKVSGSKKISKLMKLIPFAIFLDGACLGHWHCTAVVNRFRSGYHGWLNDVFKLMLPITFMIIPLWVTPLTGFQWLVRYDLYWEPYGTSEPPFSSTKGYLPSIT